MSDHASPVPSPSPLRTRAKICGITRPEDAFHAVRLGADALGFNGWKGSRRYLDLSLAASWIGALPPMVARVAVVVNPSAAEMEWLVGSGVFDAVQLHGDETPDFWKPFLGRGVQIWKALRMGIGELPPAPAVDCVVLDAAVPGEYGGTGVVCDWDGASRFVRSHPGLPVLLSGGLTPGNVRAAIGQVRPYGVDVASGVESGPGQKDPEKVRAFLLSAQRPME